MSGQSEDVLSYLSTYPLDRYALGGETLCSGLREDPQVLNVVTATNHYLVQSSDVAS